MTSAGATGQTIIKAILAGERDPHELAAYRDLRVKASEEEIALALQGNWQQDQLFVLQQEQAGYEFCQKQMTECDRRLPSIWGKWRIGVKGPLCQPRRGKDE